MGSDLVSRFPQKRSAELQPASQNPITTTQLPINSSLNKPSWLCVGTLIDGVSTTPLRDTHLVYTDEQILYVSTTPPPAHLVANKTAPDRVLPNHTLLPGLTEAHAHLFLEGAELDFEKRKAYLQLSPEALLENAKLRLEKLVRMGITAYRDAGDKHGVGLALSALYKSAKRPLMPYVDSPGAAIHHKGRYGTFMADPIEDHPDIQAVVDSRIAKGADRIKLIPTGIINFKKGAVTKEPQMSAEEVSAFVAASKKRGKQTFAHASGDDGIQNAIDGGVDSVEHGFFIRDDQLAQLRDKNIAWVPTFAPVQMQVDEKRLMGWDEQIVSNLQSILDRHSTSLAKAESMGVTIIAGSDAGSCGIGHGIHFLYELELMERVGMSTLGILNAATGISSNRLGYYDRIGKIEAGYKARFILTEHSPLETVSNLKKPKQVVFDGQLLESSESDNLTGL